MPIQLIIRTEKQMTWDFDYFPPEISYVSDNSQPLNGKHACGDTGSKTEDICGVIFQKWKDPLVEECDR